MSLRPHEVGQLLAVSAASAVVVTVAGGLVLCAQPVVVHFAMPP